MILKLKELRTKSGVTQDAVAQYLNISRCAYTNIENGKRDPDTDTIMKLAEFFRTDVNSIFGYSIPIDSSCAELLHYFNSLNPEGQSNVLRIAASLASDDTYKKDTARKVI